MSEFAHSETHRVFPVFLLLDVSASMGGEAIQAMNDVLPGLRDAIREDPATGEIARIGIITFSDSAHVVLPLSDLYYADVPALRCGEGTNFAEAFRVARREIEAGIRALGKGTRFRTPVVFVMSDGRHNARDDWTGALHQLQDRQWKFRPEVVAFGVGAACSDELSRIGSGYAFLANGTDTTGQIREIISTLVGSIKATLGSPRSRNGALVVRPDPARFTPCPPGKDDGRGGQERRL